MQKLYQDHCSNQNSLSRQRFMLSRSWDQSLCKTKRDNKLTKSKWPKRWHTRQFDGLCPSLQICVFPARRFWWNHQYASGSKTIISMDT